MMRSVIRARICLLNTLTPEVPRSEERLDLVSNAGPATRWSPRLRWLIIVGASVVIWGAIFVILLS